MNLASFVSENIVAGGISPEISDQIKLLVDEYKLKVIDTDSTIITADFGRLGSLVFREVLETEDENPILKYREGDYDYVSIICNTSRLLWTDYSDIEPYNRQSGLYCDGASFDHLGEPVEKNNLYREFRTTAKHKSNISFAISGFNHNSFYGSVSFGLCIKTNLVEEFESKLRILIGK